MTNTGGAVAIVEGDIDLQRLLVGILSLPEAALLLRHSAQLMIGASGTVAITKARYISSAFLQESSVSANRR
jgi:hypothetical protein